MLQQVDHAIDSFEGNTGGWAQGLFIFNNAPSHQKRADNALSAQRMVKDACSTFSLVLNISFFSAPKKGWVHHPGGERMHNRQLPSGNMQPLYFADDHPSMPGWFKGMKAIIREWGLWPERRMLAAQCTEFHCPPGRTDCCCWWLLFTQPNFKGQRSQLQELIKRRGTSVTST